MKAFLKIENLHVEVEGKKVLKGVNLEIKKGENHVLFGPNGSGKSTLLFAIMGYPGYEVTGGRIFFKGEEIGKRSIDERARMGIGIAYQHPPEIRGVKLESLLTKCSLEEGCRKMAEKFRLGEFMGREVNKGFSGGEVKRSELLQIVSMRPELVLLDEPDSGVDVENLSLVGKEIDKYLKKKAGLIITHQGHILDYVKCGKGHVMLGGAIICDGKPKEILECINKEGYEGCAKCERTERRR